MNTQKVVISGVVGGVVFFLLGWLIYGILLRDFMASTVGGGLMRKDSEMMGYMLYLVAGDMAFGFLLAIVFGRWANITTLMGGLMGGFLIGLLITGGFDCIGYATSTIWTMKAMLVDVASAAAMWTVAGGVVALMLGMGKKA